MQEVRIKIPDEAYVAAEKRAQQEGFGSTETFLSDLLLTSIVHDPDNFDHLFTPELIAEIDAAALEARTGNNKTTGEMKSHFEVKRKAWLENHPA